MDDMINEKLDWNEVKKYGKGIIIGTLLGLIITPNQLRDKIYRSFVEDRVTTHLQELDNYEKNDTLKTAIESVLRKVQSSKNIINKDFVINRINNVSYKEYESSHFINGRNLDADDAAMSFLYDRSSDIDYIMINMDTEHEFLLLSYVHELNHLVDTHSEVGEKISPSGLLIKDNIDMGYYHRYFNNWPKIILDGSLPSNIGSALYNVTFGEDGNSDYFESDEEIFARLSSMKSFMLKEGMINNIDEEITKHHIELIRLYAERISRISQDDYIKFLFIDFVIYLPLIDWTKADKLNLIVQNDVKSDINIT